MAETPKILIPIDGSEASDVAVRKGIKESKKSKAEIIFLYVIHIPILPEVGPSIHSTVEREMKNWAEKIIKKVEWEAENEFLKFRSIIKKGNPAEIRVETSKKEGVDLIIMAKHRRGEIDRLLLGSVTDKVLRGVRCDVLVVQP